MENKLSVELLTAEEVQEIVTPSSRKYDAMPHRISPVLTEEDKIYLQNTNNQDIKYFLIT